MASVLRRPKRTATVVLLIVLAAASVHAETTFSGLDIAPDERLLFRSTSDAPDVGRYRTLFLADAETGELTQLTHFPEYMTVLPETGEIQLQNRYGVFRSDGARGPLEPVEDMPAFVNGDEIRSGHIAPARTSPDGRYVLFAREDGAASGRLVLRDRESGEETVISRNVDLDVSGPPVKWAPDSQAFVYHKSQTLYYYSLDQLVENRVMGEELRELGTGTVRNAVWGEEGTLYYISGSLVYRARGVELFPRALYRQLLEVGEVIGTLPFRFDPNFDDFHVAPDRRSLLLEKGGRNVFLLRLAGDDFFSTGSTVSSPYLFLPRNTRVKRVAWSGIGTLTLLTESAEGGGRRTRLYRMSVPSGPEDTEVEELETRGPRDMVLSPDDRTVALLFPDRVEVRDYESWETRHTVEHRRPLHLIWTGDDELVIGGMHRIERVRLGEESGEQERQLIALSQPDGYGFGEDSAEVLVQSRGESYHYRDGAFEPAERFAVRGPRVQSERYRVYLESFDSGSYRNIVMVRDTEEPGTRRLFAAPSRRYEPLPEEGREVDFRNFVHGSRTRAREVAFTFNAIDSVEGLTTILGTLEDYDIRATFFVNGEFIRRHPGAVQEIADSGHEVGSLFYTYFDMTDARFEITEEFIKEGLAKNEDEYFDATGAELSLLWHAPYYSVSPVIIEASREMNYTYVGRDVDSLDWVPHTQDSDLAGLYRTSAQIVERILREKKPGSIIAMRVGIPGEDTPYVGRDDYLFDKLDLLIERLSERGYEIVPVSELIENAR
ncbi:MAG: polysaccharide deacetylase family protein [Spirochaetaceae bacterium]